MDGASQALELSSNGLPNKDVKKHVYEHYCTLFFLKDDMLKANFMPPKAIRGGILICFPQDPLERPNGYNATNVKAERLQLWPNGRFETQTKICLSISNYHPDHWQPSWSVRTAFVALIAFMPTNPNGALGSPDYKQEESAVCCDCGAFNLLDRLQIHPIFAESECPSSSTCAQESSDEHPTNAEGEAPIAPPDGDNIATRRKQPNPGLKTGLTFERSMPMRGSFECRFSSDECIKACQRTSMVNSRKGQRSEFQNSQMISCSHGLR
ncbi:hypothetical protein IFM89_021768 [Coptis chinensis]|uniref:UBC core domain-containing protein n=1 Tax=Coptis chinensis TaxID=261450 RepID=A0A835IQF0_9MAGN|nr:hypothetical protein IFM89_021768 [Coptis chinensis]